MKHILNNLTEQEKNAIREQHKGGMKLDTEKFSSLLESKLGDVKPLMEQQTVNVGGQKVPATTPATNVKPSDSKGIGNVTGDFKGKTVNFYTDPANKSLLGTRIINEITKDSMGLIISVIGSSRYGKNVEKYVFSCDEPKILEEIDEKGNSKWYMDQKTKSHKLVLRYSDRFTSELVKRFCSTSVSGTEVPSADFAKTSTATSGAV